jgi:hypothetical protein
VRPTPAPLPLFAGRAKKKRRKKKTLILPPLRGGPLLLPREREKVMTRYG